jgi:hypothetical protein
VEVLPSGCIFAIADIKKEQRMPTSAKNYGKDAMMKETPAMFEPAASVMKSQKERQHVGAKR